MVNSRYVLFEPSKAGMDVTDAHVAAFFVQFNIRTVDCSRMVSMYENFDITKSVFVFDSHDVYTLVPMRDHVLDLLKQPDPFLSILVSDLARAPEEGYTYTPYLLGALKDHGIGVSITYTAEHLKVVLERFRLKRQECMALLVKVIRNYDVVIRALNPVVAERLEPIPADILNVVDVHFALHKLNLASAN